MKSTLCATTLALAAATGTASTLFGALFPSDTKLSSPAIRGQEISLQPTEDGGWLYMEQYLYCGGTLPVATTSSVVGKCSNTYHRSIQCDGGACQILQFDENQDGCTGQQKVALNITADGQCHDTGMVGTGIIATLFATRDEAIGHMATPLFAGFDDDKCSGDPFLFIERGNCNSNKQGNSERTSCGADNTSLIHRTWDDSSTCSGNATTTSAPAEDPALGECHPANPRNDQGRSVRVLCEF